MNDLNVVNKESTMPTSEKAMQFLEEHIPEQALVAVGETRVLR